ncbi:hypothetical protein EI94DRAFT_1698089 [Lactarius quietus]|nr:hypothetical protein EI94DRAFT_1698089 [Lactarius quietus]
MDADGFQRVQSATSSRSLKTKSRQNAVFTPLIRYTIVNPRGNPAGNPYPQYPHATPGTPVLPYPYPSKTRTLVHGQGPPFGFLDPNAVVCMVHLIPVDDMGCTRKPLQMPSIADQFHDYEEGEFEVYYVGITLLADTHKKVQQSDAADDSEEEDNEEGSEEDEGDEEGNESDRVDKICDWSQSCQMICAGTKKDKEFGNSIGGDPSMTVTSCDTGLHPSPDDLSIPPFLSMMFGGTPYWIQCLVIPYAFAYCRHHIRDPQLGKSGPLYDNTVEESISRLGTPHPTLKSSQHVQLNVTGCLQGTFYTTQSG